MRSSYPLVNNDEFLLITAKRVCMLYKESFQNYKVWVRLGRFYTHYMYNLFTIKINKQINK
jgi:hypothetical protein